ADEQLGSDIHAASIPAVGQILKSPVPYATAMPIRRGGGEDPAACFQQLTVGPCERHGMPTSTPGQLVTFATQAETNRHRTAQTEDRSPPPRLDHRLREISQRQSLPGNAWPFNREQ